MIIDTSSRPFGGTIYAQTTPGGPFTTVVGSFGPNSKWGSWVVYPTLTQMYGIKIEINSSTDANWYQAGEVSIYKEKITNIAKAQTSVFTGGTVQGSVTDESGATYYRTGTANGVRTAGFQFTDGRAHWVRAVRYTGGVVGVGGAASWLWRNPTVQIKQNGIWSDLGTVSISNPNENVRWIDFGTPLSVQGVRFYGVIPGINKDGDVFVDEIMAFEGKPPGGTVITIH